MNRLDSPLEPANTGNESLHSFAERCRAESIAGFFPVHPFSDDRGWSFMGLFSGVLSGGQINVSTQYPNVIKAWHRHQKQTDFWFVIAGMMKVGVMSDDGARRWLIVTGERRPGVVVIPPTLWHGAATLGADNAQLLYYVTEEYDSAAPDEERQPFDWRWDPWSAEPR